MVNPFSSIFKRQLKLLASRDFLADDSKQIGRWLGVYRHDAATKTFFTLRKEKGSAAVITRSDVIPWTTEEKKTSE